MPLTTFSDLEIIVQCAPEFECNIYKTENPYFINDKVASATKETKILNIRIEAEQMKTNLQVKKNLQE